MTNSGESQNITWWKGATIYQIYPRSFCDSNGDGMGDLQGICSKLEYVANLGVDAIWVSPFFCSPMTDFGYDVSDYRDVDPIFGTLDDFKQLLSVAHGFGLKVIIDQVWSHTSDQHPWFGESRQNRDNEKADWYVWADPKSDGTPPNNWLSLFGGRAWTWDSRRQQYYMHNFLASQPDLNFHNADVRAAQIENGRFWLDLGVDGFRLDVVNFYYHHQALTDNPSLAQGEPRTLAVSIDNPYGLQRHKHDITQPENLAFLEEFRSLLNEYPSTTSIGEISDDRPLKTMSEYTSGGDKLHMAYTFDLLSDEFSPAYVRAVIQETEASIGDGWPCWALSNHDVVRHNSRWGEDFGEQFAKVSLALLLSLRGSACLYQGDELGLLQAEVPFESIQDPYGIPFWPHYKGRDGCRTPMPWTESEGVGFSDASPWLPISEEQRALCVARQQNQSKSTLKFAQRFIDWRKRQPALLHGDIELVGDSGEALCWLRTSKQQTLLVALNITHMSQRITFMAQGVPRGQALGFTSSYENGIINLPPMQAIFIELET